MTNPERPMRVRAPLALALAMALVLGAGCGRKDEDAPTQVAAKVNKREITVHQINFLLQQQRGLRAEQIEPAGRQLLERLVDQELAYQKAEDLKLDRDPRVVQQLEMARREIIARAYLEKVREAAVKPTAQEIKAYYDSKPALFSERRVYNLQEIQIEARPEQLDALRGQLAAAKNIAEFVEYLKGNGYKFNAAQAVRAAEQLPLQSLEGFAKLKDGQAVFNAVGNGVQVLVLAGSRMAPVSEEQARPAVEQFLLEERKRKLAEEDLKALRADAKIAYVGKFAAPAASGATPAAAGPGTAPAATGAASSPALSASEVGKGLGIK